MKKHKHHKKLQNGLESLSIHLKKYMFFHQNVCKYTLKLMTQGLTASLANK